MDPSRDTDDLSDIKKAILCGYVNEDDDESDGNDTSDVEEFCETKPDQKCDAYSEEVDEDLGSALRIIFREESLFPIPPNVVSAMKGSREKQGIAPKKLTVTWAPDVYDPVPTKVLPARGKKQQRSKKKNNENNKKNGKKGKKGSSSSRCGGSSGSGNSKDKKQLRKVSVISGRCFKSLDANDTLVNSPDGIEDFKVGSPDSHCGSSFLRNSHTKMHYPVAEAQ